MPVSPVSPEEISNSASAVNPLPTNRSLVGVVSNLASQVNPDLFFALGARTHTLSQLVAPIEQLRQARRVEDLPTVENLGNVLPSDETQGDLTLPVESVSLTLLMGLVDRFRGHSSGDVRLTSVCASLIKSTDNLNQSTAYQLIHVHEVLSCGPNPRPAIVESAALKLKQAYLSKIKMSPMTFAWAPLEWRQDFHVALSAAKQSGNLLRHMPFELQDNEVIVTEAVRNAPEAVQYAS
ncbi:MAG: DUF4116 domain-containing protein, partial [Limnobacter sp.]|nr:DUF4116 domain-containing protein [Limnobacter sp.]